MAYDPKFFVCRQHSLAGTYTEWLYDTADSQVTINTAGYITDAKAKGLKIGDRVECRIWSIGPTKATAMDRSQWGTFNGFLIFYVAAVNATTGTADLTDGTAASLTNSD